MDLSVFQNSNLFEAGTEFFSQLGITLNSNTSFSLDASELLKDQYKACPDLPVRSTQTGRKRRNGDVFRNIDETYFLGLMDDSVFSAVVTSQTGTNIGKLTYDEADKRLTADYNGIMVFAVRLNDAYSPKKK